MFKTFTSPHPRRSLSIRALCGLVLGVLVATALPAAASAETVPGARSPGTAMAWSRFLPDVGGFQIVIGSAGGGPVRELTHPAPDMQDIDPQFSPDGSRILFERDLPDGTTAIMVVDIDGTNEQVLPLGCADPCFADVGPTWAPDGRHVYFTRVAGLFDPVNGAASALLYRAALDGSGLTRISPLGIAVGYEDYRASFAPAGYMVFIRLGPELKSAAFRRDPDGTETQLTPFSLDADMLSVSPAVSGPSKDLIVFETFGHHDRPDGVGQAVATVPATCRDVADCTPQIRYLTSPTAMPEQAFNPSWSADGKQIGYVRFVVDPTAPVIGDIWRMNWNGTNKKPVSTSTLFEFRPAWGRPPHPAR